jgi:hypothetical protein
MIANRKKNRLMKPPIPQPQQVRVQQKHESSAKNAKPPDYQSALSSVTQ